MRYRVWFRSKPGFYAQYDGHVEVTADNESEAQDKAYLKLKADAFPDRIRGMWEVERVECLGTAHV